MVIQPLPQSSGGDHGDGVILGQAELVVAPSKRRLVPQSAQGKVAAAIVASFLLGALIVTASVCGIGLCTKEKEPSSSPPFSLPTLLPSDAPTLPPSMNPHDRLFSLLPNRTQQTIQDDPMSPQGVAYRRIMEEFMLDDPNLEDWWMRQMFAVATVVFSIRRFDWSEDEIASWLGPWANDCAWRSPDTASWQLGCSDEKQLTSLKMETGSDLYFSGSIPPELALLAQLKEFTIERSNWNARLEDVLPAPPHHFPPSLKSLILTQNNLRGTIPSQIGGFTHLEHLHLTYNDLRGQIPSELGLLTAATFLALSFGALTGTIPNQLGDLTLLTLLHALDNSNLKGTIPSFLGRLTLLESLNFQGASLSGSLPTELGLLKSLTHLGLFNNPNLAIPCELAGLAALKGLNLGNMGLSGTLPEAFCSLPTVQLDCDEIQCPEDCFCECA